MKKMVFVLKLQAILNALYGILLFILPPIIYVLYGEKQLFYAMKLPYFDFGFWGLIVYEMTLLIMGTFGTYVLDYVFVGAAFNAAAYINLVKLDFEFMEMEILKQENIGGDYSNIKHLLRNTLVRYHAMQR